ncbi:MAG: NAD-dependent protein deacylase [Panacagrimonas sp.]|jgi:NAD-dependent deacetylase|nr:NAD-dependent protein deacylase [Panacagrimonas sp.]MCC2656136.1 NAD-dependent protein deacylase [Panacagrimonas sp.]
MSSGNTDALVEEAGSLLRRARRVLVITGAGISADSGLPTYRGIGGLYETDMTEDDLPIEVALSGQMLRARPAVTWKYLSQVECACRGARPNAGHFALARMANGFRRLTVLTQNIDGFHRDAGQEHLIEIHGNVHELFCTECRREWWVKDYAHLQTPPRCEDCHGPVRPRVVLFGEQLPASAIERLEAAMDEGVDLVMSIGTTSVFPYIAGPVIQAARIGLPTIEINPGESEVSSVVSVRIPERAATVLPRLQALASR